MSSAVADPFGKLRHRRSADCRLKTTDLVIPPIQHICTGNGRSVFVHVCVYMYSPMREGLWKVSFNGTQRDTSNYAPVMFHGLHRL